MNVFFVEMNQFDSLIENSEMFNVYCAKCVAEKAEDCIFWRKQGFVSTG